MTWLVCCSISKQLKNSQFHCFPLTLFHQLKSLSFSISYHFSCKHLSSCQSALIPLMQNVRTRAAGRLERTTRHSNSFGWENILRGFYRRCLYRLENCLPLRQLFYFTQASQKSAKCRTNRTLALQSAKQVYYTIYCQHVQFPRAELILVCICVSDCFCNYNDNDF